MINDDLINLPAPSQRRRHSQAFKDQVLAACMLTGVSIASVALANQLNANYLRKWLKDSDDKSVLKKVDAKTERLPEVIL